MKKRILEYIKRIDRLLEEPEKTGGWDNILAEHLQQIAFFQHERLIHLIVTMTFAIMTIISVGIALITQIATVFLLTGVFLILLIPYIMHYYLLENNVQKMYEQYDKMLMIISKK